MLTNLLLSKVYTLIATEGASGMQRSLTKCLASCEELNLAYVGVRSRMDWIQLGLGLKDVVDLVQDLGRELLYELDSL